MLQWLPHRPWHHLLNLKFLAHCDFHFRLSMLNLLFPLFHRVSLRFQQFFARLKFFCWWPNLLKFTAISLTDFWLQLFPYNFPSPLWRFPFSISWLIRFFRINDLRCCCFNSFHSSWCLFRFNISRRFFNFDSSWRTFHFNDPTFCGAFFAFVLSFFVCHFQNFLQ